MRATHDLLRACGVSKSFPGVKALDGVDFLLRRGEIHALMGENGAGKSTLIKVLTGVYPRDSGTIELDGEPIDPRTTLEAQALGISTVYQEVNLVPYLSVAENMLLGREPLRFGCIRWREVRERAAAALARLDVHIDVTRPVASFSIAIQQLVAIARALDISARILILDEPTSSLDAKEVEQLFDVLRRLKSEGLGIVIVTHFLDQVYAIADRITVLRNGKLVGEFETASLPRVELVAKMMGKALEELEPHAPAPADAIASRQPLVEARGLGRKGAIDPLDLRIHAGEIVSLAGLLGSGRTETARLLFGIDKPDSGSIAVDGKPARVPSPRHAVAMRFGFCPEDRKSEGIIPDLSVRENIILALQASKGWLRMLPQASQREIADRYIAALKIATPDAEKPIKQLSGGNQQKAILARWLAAEPRFLILDEPTRGIDVGAKVEIEKLMHQLAEQGLAVLFISSELEEVVRNADRVVILRDRAKVGELAGDQITEQAIMQTIAAPADSEP